MEAILAMLKIVVPRIPDLIAAGADAVQLYKTTSQVISENRRPNDPEWDALEAMIAKAQGEIRDTSRDE